MKLRFLILVLPLLAANAFADEPATAPKLARGLLMQYGEKLVFAPCRDRSYTEVDDVSPDGRIGRTLAALGLGQGKRLYVEFEAALEGGRLLASEVNLARVEGRCQLSGGSEEDWRAAGNEPGWALAVAKDEIRLARPGQTEMRLAGKPEAGNDTLHVAASAETNRADVRFERKLCRDTAAEAVYAWSATVVIDGQTLRGCAWKR